MWDHPNFYVESPGTQISEVIVISGPGNTYRILPHIRDDTVVGWVVLDPVLLNLPQNNEPLDLEDLEGMEKFASNLKFLIQDVEGKRTCIASSMPVEHMKRQFERAGVPLHLLKTGDMNIYGTEHLGEFIKASQTLEIGFF